MAAEHLPDLLTAACHPASYSNLRPEVRLKGQSFPVPVCALWVIATQLPNCVPAQGRRELICERIWLFWLDNSLPSNPSTAFVSQAFIQNPSPAAKSSDPECAA